VGPFATVAPALVVAGLFAAAAAASGFAGPRWSTVHLFTLGVLTPLIVAFSQQFSRSVTRTRDHAPPWLHPTLALAAAATVVALTAGWTVVLAIAVTAATVTVAVSYIRLRAMRRAAEHSRFAWLVQTYERAHLAFVAAALLGAAMGLGAVPAGWYGAMRLAHLHVNVAGWVGLTVLGTAVFFGPAMLRTRLTDAAEATAVAALRVAACAVAAAGLSLLAVGLPAPFGTVARVVAAVALAVFAGAVVAIGRAILGFARRAHPSPARPLLVAALGWFAVAAAADAVVVAAGAWRWLDAVGVVFGVGVAAQLVVAVVLYLLPSLRGRGFAVRDALIARTELGAGLRAVVLNAGTAAVALHAAATGPVAVIAGRVGWLALALVAAHTLGLTVWPVTADPERARSSVAKRYRQDQETAGDV
jgi:nitrite reductase (NO-forming)